MCAILPSSALSTRIHSPLCSSRTPPHSPTAANLPAIETPRSAWSLPLMTPIPSLPALPPSLPSPSPLLLLVLLLPPLASSINNYTTDNTQHPQYPTKNHREKFPKNPLCNYKKPEKQLPDDYWSISRAKNVRNFELARNPWKTDTERERENSEERQTLESTARSRGGWPHHCRCGLVCNFLIRKEGRNTDNQPRTRSQEETSTERKHVNGHTRTTDAVQIFLLRGREHNGIIICTAFVSHSGYKPPQPRVCFFFFLQWLRQIARLQRSSSFTGRGFPPAAATSNPSNEEDSRESGLRLQRQDNCSRGDKDCAAQKVQKTHQDQQEVPCARPRQHM